MGNGVFVRLKPIGEGVERVVSLAKWNRSMPVPEGWIPLPPGVSEEKAVGMWVVGGRWVEKLEEEPESTVVHKPLFPEGRKVEKQEGPEVMWVGPLYNYTGYSKVNREILFRLANTFRIQLDDTCMESCGIDDEVLKRRLDAHKGVEVDPRAPLLQIRGPDRIGFRGRNRVIWTMMETSVRVHPGMVQRINENFDELWTPTRWNMELFRESGVRIPMRVVPLGVNPLIFRPWKRRPLPPCRGVSGALKGRVGSPSGFIVLTIGVPGFRKGWDVIAESFDRVFRDRQDVHLVMGVTYSLESEREREKVYREFAKYKAAIWILEGSFSEFELACIYSGVDLYVSASRGEGFNLPALEAAACGVPLILPDSTVHPEVFGEGAWFFPGEGTKEYPEANEVSPWYEDMVFTYFGERSKEALSDLFYKVWKEGKDDRRVYDFRKKILREFTWDKAAEQVAKRLLEIQDPTEESTGLRPRWRNR